jgi:mazG protein
LKFISRFQEMEKLVQERNLVLSEMSLEQMDELWEDAKKNKN